MNMYYDNDIVSYDGDTRDLTPNNPNVHNTIVYTSGDQIMINLNKTPPVPDRPANHIEIEYGLSLYGNQVQIDALLGYSIGPNVVITYTEGYNVIETGATEYREDQKPQELLDAEEINARRSEYINSIYEIDVTHLGVIYEGGPDNITMLNAYIDKMTKESDTGTMKYLSRDRKTMSDLSLDDLTSIRNKISDELQRINTDEYDPSIW